MAAAAAMEPPLSMPVSISDVLQVDTVQVVSGVQAEKLKALLEWMAKALQDQAGRIGNVEKSVGTAVQPEDITKIRQEARSAACDSRLESLESGARDTSGRITSLEDIAKEDKEKGKDAKGSAGGVDAKSVDDSRGNSNRSDVDGGVRQQLEAKLDSLAAEVGKNQAAVDRKQQEQNIDRRKEEITDLQRSLESLRNEADAKPISIPAGAVSGAAAAAAAAAIMGGSGGDGENAGGDALGAALTADSDTLTTVTRQLSHAQEDLKRLEDELQALRAGSASFGDVIGDNVLGAAGESVGAGTDVDVNNNNNNSVGGVGAVEGVNSGVGASVGGSGEAPVQQTAGTAVKRPQVGAPSSLVEIQSQLANHARQLAMHASDHERHRQAESELSVRLDGKADRSELDAALAAPLALTDGDVDGSGGDGVGDAADNGQQGDVTENGVGGDGVGGKVRTLSARVDAFARQLAVLQERIKAKADTDGIRTDVERTVRLVLGDITNGTSLAGPNTSSSSRSDTVSKGLAAISAGVSRLENNLTNEENAVGRKRDGEGGDVRDWESVNREMRRIREEMEVLTAELEDLKMRFELLMPQFNNVASGSESNRSDGNGANNKKKITTTTTTTNVTNTMTTTTRNNNRRASGTASDNDVAGDDANQSADGNDNATVNSNVSDDMYTRRTEILAELRRALPLSQSGAQDAPSTSALGDAGAGNVTVNGGDTFVTLSRDVAQHGANIQALRSEVAAMANGAGEWLTNVSLHPVWKELNSLRALCDLKADKSELADLTTINIDGGDGASDNNELLDGVAKDTADVANHVGGLERDFRMLQQAVSHLQVSVRSKADAGTLARLRESFDELRLATPRNNSSNSVNGATSVNNSNNSNDALAARLQDLAQKVASVMELRNNLARVQAVVTELQRHAESQGRTFSTPAGGATTTSSQQPARPASRGGSELPTAVNRAGSIATADSDQLRDFVAEHARLIEQLMAQIATLSRGLLILAGPVSSSIDASRATNAPNNNNNNSILGARRPSVLGNGNGALQPVNVRNGGNTRDAYSELEDMLSGGRVGPKADSVLMMQLEGNAAALARSVDQLAQGLSMIEEALSGKANMIDLQRVAQVIDSMTRVRHAEGDYAMLASKPVFGYKCMSCDHPLEKLSPKKPDYLINDLLPRHETKHNPADRIYGNKVMVLSASPRPGSSSPKDSSPSSGGELPLIKKGRSPGSVAGGTERSSRVTSAAATARSNSGSPGQRAGIKTAGTREEEYEGEMSIHDPNYHGS
eukprot:jgi/Chlat1/5608/Chrsp369S05376